MSHRAYPPIEPQDLLSLAKGLRAHVDAQGRVVVFRGFARILADQLEQLAREWVEAHAGAVGAFEAAAVIALDAGDDGYDRGTSAEISRRIQAAKDAWKRRTRA